MTTKDKIIAMIAKMPDNSSLDEIGYEIYAVESIQQGLDQLDSGEYISHEQVGEELGKWLKK